MKSVIVLLSVAIVCSAFVVRDFKLDAASLLKRQSGSSTCTNPSTTSNITLININGACSRSSTTAFCKSGLDCVTTNGGSAYTCQFLTPKTVCAGTTDCNGQSCLGGFCAFGEQLPGGSCTGNANCRSKECTNGKCAAGVVGASCDGDLTCAAGLYCSYNRTAAAGVCTTKLASGANCLAAIVATSADQDLICAKGQLCVPLYNSTGSVLSATCTAPFSAAAGTTVNSPLGVIICKVGTYAVANDAYGLSYTCSATSSCNDDNSCFSLADATCNCPTSGNGNGTCSVSCVSQYSNGFSCLFNTDFGVSTAVYSTYNSNGACHNDLASADCCAAPATAYLPNGYCSSAAVVAPVVMLIAFLALFF